MATIENIKTAAKTVKNASSVHENTAARVGGVLCDIADYLDTGLSSEIEADINSAVAAETEARKAADASEASARAAADKTLQGNIDAEAAARKQGDADETAARKSADAALQTNIESEAAARTDADKTLQENIDAEAEAREGAVTAEAEARQTADEIEEAARKAADAKLQENIDAIEAQKGKADGITPLNEEGLIDDVYLPKNITDEVLEFTGFLALVPILSNVGVVGSILFCPSLGGFIVKNGSTYSNTFRNSENYGTLVSIDKGIVPFEGKIYINTTENVPYRWDGTQMVAIAPKDTPASIFNATTEVPISGYYVLCDPDNPSISAVHAAWNADKAVSGLILSFEIGAGVWKTYQYIGKSVTEANWTKEDNWKDFGSLADGSQTYLIIDTLIGSPTVGTYYSLETAVTALLNYQTKTGVTYAKKGLVISYKTGENTMETKQFQGEVSDFGEVGLWKDFGGGSKLEASDTPEEGGTDAFSTGGAYDLMPTDIQMAVDGSTLSANLVNEAGEKIGSGASVVLPAGGGDLSGTILTIYPEQSPMYAKAGGEVKLKMAIRSVTTRGNVETDNMIEKIELVDRDTNQTLETLTVNKASSASDTTYDFELDVSSYFTTAGQRHFKIVAYDDQDKSGSRNVNVTAVDVTISSVQTLNFTSATALAVGGTAKTLPMYKFANNASDKGILATTEIYLNGKWQTLGEATVMDTYSHSVSIDPTNCLGVALEHGAYPLRIHGVDVGSGVVGNYLHTAVMVVEEGNTTPIVATRWLTDEVDGKKKLYETIEVDYAVYAPTSTEPTAEVYELGEKAAERVAYRTQTYTYSHKVTDVKYDGSVTIDVVVKCGAGASQSAEFLIDGTLLDIEEVKTQRQFSIDMSSRSNNESDHTISDSGVVLDVSGVNWSTNGFVKDNFGTSATDGDMALRIAENAKGTLHYKPFADASIEQNGMAIQFTVMKKNIADDATHLMECMSNGFGFYVDGQNVVFTFDGGKTVAHTITAALDDAAKTNVCIVIEPTSIAPYTGIGCAKMYFDGEEIGACYYEANGIVAHDAEVSFNGTEGDLYLYNIKAWKTYFGFEQEFDNYLLTMTDTDAMIEEYEFNQVMASQTAENTTKNRPQATPLYNIGIPYFVLCKNAETADNDAKDNYPEYLETLDGDKKTKRVLDIYAYFPDRPWQDFKAIGATVTNQGTTSSKRPIKNIKAKLKGAVVTLLHTEDEFTGEELEKFKVCEANAKKNRVQVLDTSLPTNIITVKVDYSESGGANNGASTNLYNDLQRGLGDGYVTPAQKAYNGTTGYVINTSICSVPCAFFRTDRYSPDATSPSYGYFHAKGNWNEDKGDAKIFGFEGVDGYNADCLNYGDFIELVANRDETLTAFAARVDKSTWASVNDEGDENVYVLSEFCGNGHKVFRYKNGVWTETTGTMKYSGGKWVVTGDVVNPVENYELLKYDALDWFQGVDSVDDMLTLDTDGKPIWLQYFESRYPDDDNLNELYESGKKVPYNLYNWLRFCQDCNQHKTAADGTITLGGVSVSGTAENRLKKWKQELHTVANVRSVLCYHVFTDYLAAVDQRSKNMMVGFYLDEDGATRMYLNHLYDGDTILGSDNDCGLTIPALLDPDNDEAGVYQGHDSVLFVQTAALGTDGFWLDDAGETTLSVRSVAQSMRQLTLSDGLVPFSYAGLVKYWITDRLQKWPKLVSSFDGERKYIQNSKSTANYFYALHGLSIQRLKDFIKTRFLYRDGFYQTGDLFSSMVSMRATGTNVQIKIRAAKDGYFGIGVDRANTATDSCYLKAGDEYTLKSGMTNTGSGTMLYIFGADKLEMLDVSGCTPSPASWDISALTLVKELVIGGADYTLQNNNEGYLTNLSLGNLPFLESLDVRNTAVTTINATYCPRLKEVWANGSQLTRVTLAEAGAIETLQLPTAYKNLTLRYLPKLTVDGITLADKRSVETLVVEDCTNIDGWALLVQLAQVTGSSLKFVRITDVEVSGDGSDLTTLAALGLQGVDATLTAGGVPMLTGEYQLTTYTDDATLEEWRKAFPRLTIEQQAYTDYKEYDNEEDSENITNTDNKTGYDYGTSYVASGHILKIREKSTPVYGKLVSGKMHMEKISKSNYAQLPDGSAFDNTDSLGEMYDCFMFIPHFWYKGINDYRKQEKHTLISSNKTMPKATYKTLRQPTLSESLYASGKAVPSLLGVGDSFTDDSLSAVSSCNTYRLDVSGCKQARYIGLNNASYGAVTVDASGKVLSVETMSITAISGSPMDFANANGDYVFCSIPDGAAWLYFTCLSGFDDTHEILAVDSADIEAIEPGWVEHKAELIGIYGMVVDDLGQARSISGKVTCRGNNKSSTSDEWTYDAEGNPKAMPTGTLNYTAQDMYNLCRLRGTGYHSISYEASKIMAVLSKCYTGNRDDQRVYGFGTNPNYTTGTKDSTGMTDTVYGGSSGVNKVWGIEAFIACMYEFMDCVGVNITTFAKWMAAKRPEDNTYPQDYKWHIYDNNTKTERVVQACAANYNGNCIARLRHGRYCDIVPASVTTDTSKYNTCWAAGYWSTTNRGRVVGRASYYASAVGGLVFAYACYASSFSLTYDGVRLAFDGELENESDIDDEA